MLQNFLFHVFTLQKLPSAYESLEFKYKNDSFNVPIDLESEGFTFKNSFEVIEDVPGYLNVELRKLPSNIGFKRIKQYPGFRIDFKGVKSLEDYLETQFGRSSRYKLRRGLKKLETCFDIRYRMYYGKMKKEEYEYVFKSLYDLLEIRSLEKGIKNNRNFKTKELYFELVYPLLLEKKASFFVIYNKGEPIDICLNFHMGNILFQFIRTYDIAYSKFNTGYIDLMKQIEWCFENGIRSISFSKGDFYWKRRWCNVVYDYEFHIFYNRSSIISRLKSHVYLFKRQIRQFLRENGIIEQYHKLRDKYLRRTMVPKLADFFISKTIKNSDSQGFGERVDYNRPENLLLKRALFELLYQSGEREAEIAVYKSKKHDKKFLVKGLNINRSINLR